MRRASIYVHFPWCLAKCPYCDFVSYATPREAIDHAGYADAILRELEARARATRGAWTIGSIFFGGGTPSLWEPRELGRVLARALALFGRADGAPPATPLLEVTVECNPTSLDLDRARALADVGVNRLSIGTQALDAKQLAFLGRLHDPAGALAAVEAALTLRDRVRVSTDMIFGLPEQSPEDARAQAMKLADLGLDHLSCYQLTIEPGTRFGELAKRGRLPLADDARVAESFLAIDEALESRGLAHYEISNYARPGEEARHNLGYWRGDEYLGVGCGAYGFVRSDSAPLHDAPAPLDDAPAPRSGVRYRNAIDPRRYVDATREAKAAFGEGDGVSMTSEPLDGETMLRERIMLGLRLDGGFDLAGAARELGVEGWTAAREREAARLEAIGRLARPVGEPGRAYIPRGAWLWTDDTAARLF
jgi:oxygen-independent coproporphyrinogen-3 oxidase